MSRTAIRSAFSDPQSITREAETNEALLIPQTGGAVLAAPPEKLEISSAPE
jgi:hypothetical protein